MRRHRRASVTERRCRKEDSGRAHALIGSRSTGGFWVLLGPAVLFPFTAQAGGHTECGLRPRQPQVVLVACHHSSCSHEWPPSPLSETNTIRVSGPGVFVRESTHTCRSSQLCTHMSSCWKAHSRKKAWSSEKIRSAWLHTCEDIWWCAGPANDLL